LVYSFNALILF